MISERFLVNSDSGRLAAARFAAEDFAVKANLDRRSALRLTLLTEETLGMMQSVVDEFDGELWFAGDGDACEIHLEATAGFDHGQKNDLLAMAHSGRNAAAKGFMGMLGDTISSAVYNYSQAVGTSARVGGIVDATGLGSPVMVYDMAPIWTLDQYRRDAVDEAAETLERSIVAQLADDVVVGVKGNRVELVILMRFNPEADARKRRWIETERLKVDNAPRGVETARKLAEDYAERASLGAKESLRLCLLVEEILGMLRGMSDGFEGQLWLEGDSRECRVNLEADARLAPGRKRDLIAVSTEGRNAMPRGFMARIGAMIQDLLDSADAYGAEGYLPPTMPEYMAFGTGLMTGVVPSMRLWTLSTARQKLRDDETESAQAARDDLEQSIVAMLADDVTVGIHGRRVNLVIDKKFGN